MKKNPLFKLGILSFCLVAALTFFMVFNTSFFNLKEERSLASSNQENPKINSLVAETVSESLNKKDVEIGSKPSPQDQFLIGFLEGRYEAKIILGKIRSLKLKEGQSPLIFKGKEQINLVKKFKESFFNLHARLEKIKSRDPASSLNLDYRLSTKDDKLEITFYFNASDELESVTVK